MGRPGWEAVSRGQPEGRALSGVGPWKNGAGPGRRADRSQISCLHRRFFLPLSHVLPPARPPGRGRAGDPGTPTPPQFPGLGVPLGPRPRRDGALSPPSRWGAEARRPRAFCLFFFFLKLFEKVGETVSPHPWRHPGAAVHRLPWGPCGSPVGSWAPPALLPIPRRSQRHISRGQGSAR